MLPNRPFIWLFLALPLLELYVLIKLGALFGFLAVLLWIIASGAIGFSILQSQSWAIWNRIQQAIAAGQSPGRELLDTAFVIAGGVLLIIPGLITDILALLCLVPPSRHRIARYLERRFETVSVTASGTDHPSRTIEGEYRRED